MQDYPKLAQEKEQLGCPGSKFDFSSMDMNKKQAQYERARKDKEAKERCVNKAVLSKAEKMEKDFNDLSERRATVLKDREQIKLV